MISISQVERGLKGAASVLVVALDILVLELRSSTFAPS
jgi:hypothetical protein